MTGLVRFVVLVGAVVACWLAGTELAGAAGGVGSAEYRPLVSQKKKTMLWSWYRNSGAECVRQHEGSWTDPNPLYFGGFQANIDFQRAYGRHYGKHVSYLRFWGTTADGWPLWAQIHMARHGWQARGWYPWPTTARICGLI